MVLNLATKSMDWQDSRDVQTIRARQKRPASPLDVDTQSTRASAPLGLPSFPGALFSDPAFGSAHIQGHNLALFYPVQNSVEEPHINSSVAPHGLTSVSEWTTGTSSEPLAFHSQNLVYQATIPICSPRAPEHLVSPPPSFPTSHTSILSSPYPSGTTSIPWGQHPSTCHDQSPLFNSSTYLELPTSTTKELWPLTNVYDYEANGGRELNTQTYDHTYIHVLPDQNDGRQGHSSNVYQYQRPVTSPVHDLPSHHPISEDDDPGFHSHSLPSHHTPYQLHQQSDYTSDLLIYSTLSLAQDHSPSTTVQHLGKSDESPHATVEAKDAHYHLIGGDGYFDGRHSWDHQNGHVEDSAQTATARTTEVQDVTSPDGSLLARSQSVSQPLAICPNSGHHSPSTSGSVRTSDQLTPATAYATPALPLQSIGSGSDQIQGGDSLTNSISSTQTNATAHRRPPGPESLPGRSRKRRGRFDDDKRDKVNRTRKLGACLVCRMQRNECPPNDVCPDDPAAPCGRCTRVSNSKSRKVVYRVPCVRTTIEQLILYRPGELGLTRRWEGTKVKDIEDWADNTIRIIHMDQGLCDRPMEVRVRRFIPRDTDILWKGSPDVVLPPYCLANVDETAIYFRNYLRSNLRSLAKAVRTSSHDLVRETYDEAVRHAFGSLPFAISRSTGTIRSELEREQAFLLDAIQLIYAIKHMSGSVAIVGEDKLGIESPSGPDQPVGLPRMIVAQWDGIQNEKILKGLSRKVLSTLEKYLTSKNQTVWFTIYLVVFLILHEISVATKDRYRWAQENVALTSWSRKARYGRGKLAMFVEHLQASANTILAYWEYYKTGIDLQAVDWSARNGNKQLSYLTVGQAEFIQRSVGILREQEPYIPRGSEEGCWEHELYFISHMVKKHEKPIETFNYVEP